MEGTKSPKLTREMSRPQNGDVEELPEYNSKDARAALWRIDCFILPVLAVGYMLQFLDKMSLTYASIMGISEDLNLVGSNYSWASSIVYLAQLVFSYPASVLLVRFSVVKTVSTSMMAWGAIVMLHGVCSNFGGLMTVRLLLGVFEAAVSPAFGMIVGAYYRREEHGLRQCLWFLGNGVSGLFGSMVAYGIAHIEASIAQWKILFLIFGGLTVFWGAFQFVAVADSPKNAWFLTKPQREAATIRLKDASSEKANNMFRLYQTWEALRDPAIWCLIGYTMCTGICNGGLASFSSLIIKGFGYSTVRTYLLQMSIYGSQIGWVLIGAIIPRYVKNCRYALMIVFLVIALIGCLMIHLLPEEMKEARLGGICLVISYVPIFPLNIAVSTSNFKGYTKQATALALVMMAYCLGNVIGPQFYFPREAPHYRTGIMSALACFSKGILFVTCNATLLVWRNYTRNQGAARRAESVQDRPEESKDAAEIRVVNAELDITDLEDPDFRYIL